MALQIVTFKWGNKYTIEHVKRLRSMLKRNLTIPFDFVLITDDPLRDRHEWEKEWHYPAIRILPLWDEMRDAHLCGVRLRAFGWDMAAMIGPRFAWIDLDVVITGNVDHIFGRTEPFIALSTPQGPLEYNGSLVMMNAGARNFVFRAWNPEAYSKLPAMYAAQQMPAGGQSDEGWMTLMMPGEPRFNGGWGRREDGIYFFRHDLARGAKPLPGDARMVIMNGRGNDPANAEAQRLPWVREHWR